MTEWTRAARVLRRASFGASGAEIDAAVAMGLDRWLDASLAGPEPTYPSYADIPEPGKGATLEEKRVYREKLAAQGQDLLAWWLRQMVTSPTPLTERLAFGWHQHWATSISKVNRASMMLQQQQTIRRTGLGSFTTMAKAMVVDPALMTYLDAQQNSKQAPNENLARELMELFCLGVGGGYTETDVKEAARALTGWRLDAQRQPQLDPKRFDSGSKKLLGVTGALDANGAVDAILAAPGHPGYLATRWWRHLASPEAPSAAALARLTGAYGRDRQLRPLFRAILTDPEFDAAAGSMVLSPVEWVVGTLRVLKVALSDQVVMQSAQLVRSLGQVPLQPPNVSGWPSGQAWLSTASAQARTSAVQRLAKAGNLSAVADAKPTARIDATAHLLGVARFSPRTVTALETAKGDPTALVGIALVSPEYLVA